jgi:hypothetical protein
VVGLDGYPTEIEVEFQASDAHLAAHDDRPEFAGLMGDRDGTRAT